MIKDHSFEHSEIKYRDELNDHCGVVAVASKSKTSNYIYYCLRAVQHRGQEATGIAVFNKKIVSHKGIGLVADVFDGGSMLNVASLTCLELKPIVFGFQSFTCWSIIS